MSVKSSTGLTWLNSAWNLPWTLGPSRYRMEPPSVEHVPKEPEAEWELAARKLQLDPAWKGAGRSVVKVLDLDHEDEFEDSFDKDERNSQQYQRIVSPMENP